MTDEIKGKLIDLVDYVGKMVKLGEKPVYSVRDYNNLIFQEEQFKNKIGITHDQTDENGPIWLSIERLKRIDPPMPPETIEPWISVSRDSSAYPSIEKLKVETVSKKKAEEYLDAGLADSKDIQPSLKQEEDDETVDVILRIQRFPDIQTAVNEYIQGPWKEWSEAEKLRRETIKIYEAFFNFHQSINNQGAEKPLELVWGMGVARWKHNGKRVDHSLVEQLVEIEIDPVDSHLSIRPRSSSPHVFLQPFFDMDLAGAQTVFDFSEKFFDNFTEDQELSPFHSDSFEPVLRQAATHIDKRGVYYPDVSDDFTNRALPEARDFLTVTDTWSIYVRRKSDNFFINDLHCLKKAIESLETLTGPARRLVSLPDDEPAHRGDRMNPANANHADPTSNSIEDALDNPEDFLFPKPFNDEQIMIGKRLADSDGTVVQGPPGTGKTHTIANIICHYMAMGKRVLVTSKGEAALTVLREHIPENIRELSISLLTNERQGLKQLEKAVTLLSNTSTRQNANTLRKDILSVQQRITGIKEQMASIDVELHQWAKKHLEPVFDHGCKQGILPMELARQVVADKGKYDWFVDRPVPDEEFTPLFSDDDIIDLRIARKELGPDLDYQDKKLPSLSDLPGSERLVGVHNDLINAEKLERQAQKDQMPLLSMSAKDAVKRAQNLIEAINDVIHFYDKTKDEPWLLMLFAKWNKAGFDSDRTKLFDDLIPAMQSIAEKRIEVVGYGVEIDDESYKNPCICMAVERVCSGKRPFGWVPLGKSQEKAQFKHISVSGNPPEGPDDWRKVFDYINWRKEILSFCSRWANASYEFELPQLDDTGDAAGYLISERFRLVQKAMVIVQESSKLIAAETPSLFPHGLVPGDIMNSVDGARKAADAIEFNLSKNRLLRSHLFIEQTLERLGNCSGPIADQIKVFLNQCIGNSEYKANEITVQWQTLCTEVKRVHELAPKFEMVRHVAELIQKSGAKNWAKQLLSSPVENETDPLTPGDWEHAWNWAAHEEFIKSIEGRDRIRELFKSQNTYEKEASFISQLTLFEGS